MSEHIQINDVAPHIAYVADGLQSAFTYPFAIFRAEDLEVWLDDTRQSAGFSVSGAGISAGGSVLFAVPPAAGRRVTLRRRLAVARTGDYQADGLIRAKTLNDEFDYQVAALQQVAEDVARSLRRSPTSASLADLTLPEPAAGRGLKWNGDGSALVNSTNDPDAIGDATQAAATAVEAAAAATVARDQAMAAAGGVRVSVGDAIAAPLADKLVAGTGIALTPGGDGEQHLTIAATVSVPASIFDRLDFLERNLAVNTLRDQIDAGWSVLKMVDGVADEFEDESGVVVPLTIDANTKLLIHADGADGGTSFTDASPSGFSLTTGGNATVSASVSKFGGGAVNLGTTGYLQGPTHSALDLAGDFTIDFWAYMTGTATEFGFCRKTNGDGNALGWMFGYNSQLAFYVNANNGTGVPWTPIRNQWVHIALVRSGNVFTFFVNGTAVGSTTAALTINPATSSNFILGYGCSYGSGMWTAHNTMKYPGYIDEFRVSNVARWTSAFTPQSYAYGEAPPGSSSGHSYDPVADCYKNASTPVNVIAGKVPTSNVSMPYGAAAYVTDGAANGSTYWQASGVQSGNFRIRFDCGVGAAHRPNRFRQWHDGAQSSPGNFVLWASNTGAFSGEEAQLGSGTYTNTAGWQEHVFTAPSTGYRYFEVRSTTIVNGGNSANNPLVFEMELYADGPATAMTLVSQTFPADAEPAEARLVLLHQPVDATALGTDCTIEASRDGGTTWTVGTLTDKGPFDATTDILAATIDLSAHPAGTSLRWRFRTYNNKAQRLHGVWMQWR